MSQKTVWIVKWLPDGDDPCTMRGINNRAYETYSDAEERCKYIAAESRRPVGIFELVAAFQPPLNVEPITITPAKNAKAKKRT